MNKKMLMWVVGSIGGGGVALAVLAMALQFWISTEVGVQLEAAGIVPASTVTALDTRVDNLEVEHEDDIDRVESKAERIAQILMED